MVRAALALLCASGCATVLAGGPDRIPVVTNPPGASIYVNGRLVGQSPSLIELERDARGIVQLTMPGFRTVTIERHKTLNAPFVLSVLLIVTIVPPIVDIAASNWLSYDDAPIAIRMKPEVGMPPQPRPPVPRPHVRPAPPEPRPPEPLPPAPYVPPGTQ
jgi:hypothetical protein